MCLTKQVRVSRNPKSCKMTEIEKINFGRNQLEDQFSSGLKEETVIFFWRKCDIDRGTSHWC